MSIIFRLRMPASVSDNDRMVRVFIPTCNDDEGEEK